MFEKEFNSIFGKWVRENRAECAARFGASAAFELKMCRGNSVRHDAVQPHQIKALEDASGEGVYHKIADQTIGRGDNFGFTRKKPFDCFFISGGFGWLAVMLYRKGQRRAERETVFVRVERWKDAVAAGAADGRVSITKDEMKTIGLTVKLEAPKKQD